MKSTLGTTMITSPNMIQVANPTLKSPSGLQHCTSLKLAANESWISQPAQRPRTKSRLYQRLGPKLNFNVVHTSANFIGVKKGAEFGLVFNLSRL